MNTEDRLKEGLACFARKDATGARAAFENLIADTPDLSDAHFHLGRLYEALGQPENALNAYANAVACSAPIRDAFPRLAALYNHSGQKYKALQTMRAAEETFPQDPELTYMRGRYVTREVPLWHLPMLADQPRNLAYQQAIEAQVTPGDIVLDIGTGSGLLAMMAVRAGAEHVYACEVNPVLAGLAQDVITANGFQDQITLLPKHSTELETGKDLPGRADLLLTEIFDNALIGEGALPSIAHAWQHLLKPDARVIPQKGTLYGQLIESPHFEAMHRAGAVCGFDLSHINALAHPLGYKDINFALEDVPGHRLMSDPFMIWSLNFRKAPEQIHSGTTLTRSIANGQANAVLMWFDLHLTTDVSFSTRAPKPEDHWRQVCQILLKPMICKTDTPIELNITYDRFFHFEQATA